MNSKYILVAVCSSIIFLSKAANDDYYFDGYYSDQTIDTLDLYTQKRPPKANLAECQSPLYHAISRDNKKEATRLLQTGHNPDCGIIAGDGNPIGATPLHKAIRIKDTALVKLLLTFNANIHASNNRGTTPLHRAAIEKNAELLEMLLTQDPLKHVHFD